MGSGAVSRSTPVPGPSHVSRPLIQRVQVLLLEALLQVGHAGVGVLTVVAPTPTPSSATTWTPTPAHSTPAMSGWDRGHALKGLCWWWELGAHGLPRRALIPGTDQSQRRRYSQGPHQQERRQQTTQTSFTLSNLSETERWTLVYHLVLMGKLLLGNGCEVAVGFM